MFSRRKRRVRLHLVDPGPGSSLPSVEGLLVGYDHNLREYRVAVGELHWNPEARPDRLVSREQRFPRERVAFYEVL